MASAGRRDHRSGLAPISRLAVALGDHGQSGRQSPHQRAHAGFLSMTAPEEYASRVYMMLLGSSQDLWNDSADGA